MKLWRLLIGLLVLGAFAAPAVALPHDHELFRSDLGIPRWVSVDPGDGSCWATIGSRVYQITTAKDGTVTLARVFDGWRPQLVGPDIMGGCWIVDRGYPNVDPSYPSWYLIHYTLGWPTPIDWYPFPIGAVSLPNSLDVNTATGEVFLAGRGGVEAAVGLCFQPGVGDAVLDVSVDPGDASLWVTFPRDYLVGYYVLQGTPPHYVLSWQGGRLPGSEPIDARVATSPYDHTAWVTDRTHGHVLCFNVDSSQRFSIGGFLQPGPISIATTGAAWIAEANGASLIAPTGVRVWSEASTQPPGTLLPTPALCANAKDGSVWVVHDGGPAPRIIHYDPTGALLWQLPDTLGPLPYAAVNAANGSVWTADQENNRLIHLAGDGARLNASAATSHLERPDFVLVDPRDGSVLANDRGLWDAVTQRYSDSRLVRFAPDGAELFRSPSAADTLYADLRHAALNPADGSIWVARDGYDAGLVHHAPYVVRLTAAGVEAARYTGSFATPLSLAVSPLDGSCWMAATVNSLTGEGALIRIAPNGTELTRVRAAELGGNPTFVTTNAHNGVLWVLLSTQYDDWECRMLAMVGPEGGLIWCQPYEAGGISVDPTTGFAWVTAGEYLDILSNTGTQLWHGDGFNFSSPSVPAAVAADGSCWAPDTLNGQMVHVAVPLTPFDDIGYCCWARKEIAACAAAGIVNGYPVGGYRPDVVVTRDQMAVFIARALLGGEANVPAGPSTATFPDVPTGFWAFKHVEYAVAQGIVQGYPDGTYQPGLDLDRAQMAVFLARALCGGEGNVPIPSPVSSFWDVSPDFWAYKHIEYIRAAGIASGYPDRSFQPTWDVTRDQMAVFITRAFNLPTT